MGTIPPELNVSYTSDVTFDIDRIRDMITQLSLDTGPGFPYCYFYNSKRDVVTKEPDNLISCVLGRLKLYHQVDYLDLMSLNPTPIELVLWGLHDFVRVFVKNEPTKTTKIGIRERIINSVSLIQLLTEMYLFHSVDLPKKTRWYEGPGCVGIGFTDPMASLFASKILEEIPTSYDPFNSTLVTTDVKSMDYSQSEQVINLSVFQKIATNRAQGTAFANMSFINSLVLARPSYVLSNGEIFSQLLPGGRRSGEYDTSFGNTTSRSSLIFLAARKFGKVSIYSNSDPKILNSSGNMSKHVILQPLQRAQGDDAINQQFCSNEDLSSFFAEFGMVLTGFELGSPDDFLFCSQRWVDGKCIPLNIIKQMYNLLSNKYYDEDKLKQYIFEHHNDPQLSRQLDIFIKSWPLAPGSPRTEDYEELIRSSFLSTPPI